jgi:transposase
VSAPPDPEVSERPVRRRFTAEYKLRIVEEADHCKDTKGIGSLLRREGLYSSHLSTWRQQRNEGSLSALAPRKRGRPAEKPHPDTLRLAQSERKNKHLERRLKQAEALLDLQKKVSEILGIVLPPAPIDEGE